MNFLLHNKNSMLKKNYGGGDEIYFYDCPVYREYALLCNHSSVTGKRRDSEAAKTPTLKRRNYLWSNYFSFFKAIALKQIGKANTKLKQKSTN